jgi:hypothetical protein
MHRHALACCCSIVTLIATSTPVAAQRVYGLAVYTEGSNGSVSYVTSLPTPAPESFDALRVTYSDLKIPVTMLDPDQHTLGTTGWTVPHRLAGRELSRYFDCGAGRGRSADELTVKLTIRSTISPDSAADRSTLNTALSVTASDPGQMSHPTACQTTGELEARLSEALMKTIKK